MIQGLGRCLALAPVAENREQRDDRDSADQERDQLARIGGFTDVVFYTAEDVFL